MASAVVAAAQLRLPFRLSLFDELGIPYVSGRDPMLSWPSAAELEGIAPRWHEVAGVAVFARCLGNEIVRRAGEIRLPFDPDEALVNLRREAYVREGMRAAARRAYYRVRPLLPRPVQLAARRSFTRVQGRATFPAWPVETAADDLTRLVVGLAEEAVGGSLPTVPNWPQGHRWALVLTHDVETAAGLTAIEPLRLLEERYGYHSSWNLVPERYRTPDELAWGLRAAGHELGVHGLRHDGRDLASRRLLERRLPAMRAAAERWGAVGFRAPATQRRWEWMPLLGFEYDSSYPDTDPYEPQAGGCCSSLPFFNGDLVELPITVPQDHTVFEILGHEDESVWVEKIEFLRAHGRMALVLTHPDYLPVGGPAFRAYERVLARYAGDATAWKALPRDVAAWWRRRSRA
jgi:peptidoglycan/xylan/chitin deacetylase (PgdA/CDA1 family)